MTKTETRYEMAERLARRYPDDLVVTAVMADASSPVVIVDGDGVSHPTPFQVADCRHDDRQLARLVAGWDGWGAGADAVIVVSAQYEDGAGRWVPSARRLVRR